MEHAEEVFGVLPEPLAFIEGSVLGLGVIRPVRCIGGHPGEERPLGGGFAFDPPSRLGEELIGAVDALGLFCFLEVFTCRYQIWQCIYIFI